MKKQQDSMFQARVQRFGARLQGPGPPMVSLTFGSTLFSRLGGTDLDEDEDGLIDEDELLARWSLAGNMDWRFSETGNLILNLNYFRERASAEQGANLTNNFGWGVTWAIRLAILDPDYKKSKAFLESFFIPSVSLGLDLSGDVCSSEDDCKDNIENKIEFTPFVDVKISSASMFQIGFPIEFRKVFPEGTDRRLGILTAISFKLGA